MTEAIDAEAFLSELLRDARTGRRRATLNAVWQSLSRVVTLGQEVTVANVARIAISEYGGPTEQSIRNDARGMRRLVELVRARCTRALPSYIEAKSATWIDEIADALVRARCHALTEQIRLLEKENNRLRSLARRIEPLRCDPSGAEAMESATSPLLTAEEHAAISQLLAGLEAEGFSIDVPSGELVSKSGRTVASAALTGALQKLSVQPKQALAQQEPLDATLRVHPVRQTQ